MTRSRVRFLVPLVLMLVLGVGFYAGQRSPWGTKHSQEKQGIAMRANAENDLVMFDGDDGTQVMFRAGGIWWTSDSLHGEGDPPCLRKPLRKVDVEVGVVRMAVPDGGWHTQVAWVRCP